MVEQVEQVLRRRVVTYLVALRQWQDEQGIGAEPPTPDPLTGTWQLSGKNGCMVFDNGQFTWYRKGTEGDHYRGSYGVRTGVKLHQGFIADRGQPDTNCYSIIMAHQIDFIDGQEVTVDRSGLWFAMQLGDPDKLGVYNHRTASNLVAERQ